jgi:hypothetical protein
MGIVTIHARNDDGTERRSIRQLKWFKTQAQAYGWVRDETVHLWRKNLPLSNNPHAHWILKLPQHCLWCGIPLIDVPASQRFCKRTHANQFRFNYRPERCPKPDKKPFAYRGTAIMVVYAMGGVGDCYRCECGAYHLTRKKGIINELRRTETVTTFLNHYMDSIAVNVPDAVKKLREKIESESESKKAGEMFSVGQTATDLSSL